MNTNIVVFFMLLLAFAHSVGPVIDTSAVTNTFCTSDGKTSWKFDKLTGSTTPPSFDFDEASAFKDFTTGDSVPLMLRKAINSAPYTFITLDKNTLAPTEKICKDTIGYNFVVLGNNVLFLEKSGEYYICVFDVKDTNGFFVPTQLTKPSSTDLPGTISSFNILNLESNLPDNIYINVVWGD